MAPKARRQQKLAIPVTSTERAQVEALVAKGVDGAASVADLVRKLLKDRFQRYLAEGKAKAVAVRKVGKRRVLSIPAPTPAPQA